MKRTTTQDNNQLRPEYDLKSLQVRKLGPGRKAFGKTPDLKEAKTESILQTIDQRTDRMSQTFAEVVEDVKQLSPAEKEELQDLLKKYLIDERRRQLQQNSEVGLKEFREGTLKPFSDVDELMDSLHND